MAEPSNGCSQQNAEINMLNSKLAYDDSLANSRAWNAFNLSIAQDAQTLKQLAVLNVINSSQTGDTANQQTTSPIRTGVGDYVAAGAVPANRATDVAAAGVATANQGIADALATAVSFFNQGLAALSSVLTTAAGGASTPSQTTPKGATS